METHRRNIMVQYLLPLVATILVGWAPASQTLSKTKWLISESSTLRINGSTNVNTFACDITGYDQVDTLEVMENAKSVRLSGCLNINIQQFDCHNPVMTRDLRKTLNTQQFPTLTINFLSLSKFPTLSRKPEPITGHVDIELAGVRKRVEVMYKISVDENKAIHLLGQRDVKFSDFNLVPPTKFKGVVKTNQTLSITFHLKLEPISNQLAAK